MKTIVPLLLASCVHCALLPGNRESLVFRAVSSVLAAHSPCEHTTLLLLDGKEREEVQAPRGISVFQVAADYLNPGDATQENMRATVDKIRQMGQQWHCLVLVVVSDDPSFLAAFAHLSHVRHALRWSTRILVFTRLPISQLSGLHGLLSSRNAMLLRMQDKENVSNTTYHNNHVGMYVWQPYSVPSSTPLKVATWTLHGWLTPSSHITLFPEKFYVFSSPPTLTVAIEYLPYHTLTWVADPDATDGLRLVVTGFLNEFVQYLAKAMNFRYRYVVSSDRTYGTRLANGSWTGLMGMVVREEADFAPGPFIMNPMRYEAAEPTTPYSGSNIKILGGLTGLKVDPWGFLLPLTPLVWAVILMVLLWVHSFLELLSFCLPGRVLGRSGGWANTFSSVRVILQQDIVLHTEWWWWERLVLGLWILTTLVLSKSYAGNLMSLLAVRYVPQPFQTLRDVLDHLSVTIMGQKHSSFEQTLREMKSGVLREVADLEDKGRLEFHTPTQIPMRIDTVVRAGTHVYIDLSINLRSHIALDFSKNGHCAFYLSRDGVLPMSACMMTQKTNPLVYGFNKRLMATVEHGLRTYWIENVPNFTECDNVPKKIVVSTHISVSNIWGVFVVLAGGLATGLIVWCIELLIGPTKEHFFPSARYSGSSYK